MSSLKTVEKQPFEDLLEMGGGYVLDFTNLTFESFFVESVGKDIYSPKYEKYGDSKAKRLRAFWEVESDSLVGKVLSDLIEIWEYKNPEPSADENALASRCREVASRLLRKHSILDETEDQFLKREFKDAKIGNVPIGDNLIAILEARFEEAVRCLRGKAPLAAIFMCGSVLEGLLLGMAMANPRSFNQAICSPKSTSGKVKPFPEWSLAQLIDVACELKHLRLDVKKFSHALRDFRNYIHPYQQMTSSFKPDVHTAEICLQVLRAAIVSLSGSTMI